MAMTRESTMKKVQALLNKAESTEFSEERDAFRRKADDLMLRYAIESWELEQTGEKKKEAPELRSISLFGPGNIIGSSLVDLIADLAHHSRCQLVFYGLRNFQKNPTHYGVRAGIVGYPSDLDYVEMLFNSLRLQLATEMEPKPSPTKSEMENITELKSAGLPWPRIIQLLGFDCPEHEANRNHTADCRRIVHGWRKYAKAQGIASDLMHNNPKTFQRSYAEGFVQAVSARLYAIRQDRETTEQSGSYLPALMDRSQEVSDAFKQFFPKVGKSLARQDRTSNAAGYRRGAEAGRRADLGQTKVGGNRKQLG